MISSITSSHALDVAREQRHAPDGLRRARTFDSTGTPLGGEFQVNSNFGFGYAAVTTDGAGNFVVTWENFLTYPLRGIGAQRFDNAGTPQGGEFQINTTPPDLFGIRSNAVTADAAGNFVAVWVGDTTSYGSPHHYTLQGRRYDGTGMPQGLQFEIDSDPVPSTVSVASDVLGENFVVVWSGGTGSDADGGIKGQRFAIVPTTTTSSTPTTSTSSTSTTLPTTDLLPGRSAIIKPGTLAKFVAKPVTGDTFALPAANPIAAGGSLRIFDSSTTAGDNSYALPLGANWKALGSPAGSKGYKYRGAGSVSDPCALVLLRKSVIRGVCKGLGVTLTPPFTGDVGIVLSLGTTERYCARFGGDESRNDATLTKRKDAPAPGACP
jgi:hypothetical protein